MFSEEKTSNDAIIIRRYETEPEGYYLEYLAREFGVETYEDACRMYIGTEVNGCEVYNQFKEELKATRTVRDLNDIAEKIWRFANNYPVFSKGRARIKIADENEDNYWSFRNRVIRFAAYLFRDQNAYKFPQPRRRETDTCIVTTAAFQIPSPNQPRQNYAGDIRPLIVQTVTKSFPDYYSVGNSVAPTKFWSRDKYAYLQIEYIHTLDCTAVWVRDYGSVESKDDESFTGCVGKYVRFVDDGSVVLVTDYITTDSVYRRLVLTEEGKPKGFKLQNGRECYVKNQGKAWFFEILNKPVS